MLAGSVSASLHLVRSQPAASSCEQQMQRIKNVPAINPSVLIPQQRAEVASSLRPIAGEGP